MNEDYTQLRNAQLASYRAEQAAEQSKFKNYTNTPAVSASSLRAKAKTVLNTITALNIANLNIPGGNVSERITGDLNKEIWALYNVLDELRRQGQNGNVI